jgi:hypothetical protein
VGAVVICKRGECLLNGLTHEVETLILPPSFVLCEGDDKSDAFRRHSKINQNLFRNARNINCVCMCGCFSNMYICIYRVLYFSF